MTDTTPELEEARENVGCMALWLPFEGKSDPQWQIPVRIKDARILMGRTEYFVFPLEPAVGRPRWVWSTKLDIQ